MFEFLAKIPLWIYFLIGGIIIFIIWIKLPFDAKIVIKKLFKNPITYLFLFGIAWYIWGRYGKTMTIRTANYWMPFLLLIIFLIMNTFGNMRYHTRQIITPNFHGSFTKAKNVNGFIIFNIGSFDAFGISIPMANKILILREETTIIVEEGAISISRISPVTIYELDSDVKTFIEKTSYLKNSKNNIFYGWFDDINKVDWDEHELMKMENNKKDFPLDLLKKEFNVENPSVNELYRLYRNINKAYNRQGEILGSVIDDTEEGIEHFRRRKRAYEDRQEKIEKVEGFEGE